MKLQTLENIFSTLNISGVRYLVAGGLAVVAHGYVRFTADIDLILDMEKKNLKEAMTVFSSLGYRPRAPVALDDFVDEGNRKAWMHQKGMMVFSLWNPDHPFTEIDLFIDSPLSFEKAEASSKRFELSNGLQIAIIGIDDLIALKKLAKRAKDLDDIEKLSAIKEGINDE